MAVTQAYSMREHKQDLVSLLRARHPVSRCRLDG
jgi:hypothetical protein